MSNDASGTTKRALITGASAGIGEGFARQMARQGYDLVLVARRKDRLDALASELSSKHSISADAVEADLAGEHGLSLVEERLRSGEIEVLVNNAGFGTTGEFAELSLEREVAELDLNIRAVLRLTHAALAAMVPRKRGAIINVASMAAFQPIPYNATYAASKAFVLHFSEAVHEEVRRHGVTVTCLCPGLVRTEFQQVAGLDADGIPAISVMSVDAVVRSALSAMRGGRAITVPGAVNVATVAGTRMAPRFLVRRIAASMFRNRATATKAE